MIKGSYYYSWMTRIEDGKVYTDKDFLPLFTDREECIKSALMHFEDNPHLDLVEVFQEGVANPIKTFERTVG